MDACPTTKQAKKAPLLWKEKRKKKIKLPVDAARTFPHSAAPYALTSFYLYGQVWHYRDELLHSTTPDKDHCITAQTQFQLLHPLMMAQRGPKAHPPARILFLQFVSPKMCNSAFLLTCIVCNAAAAGFGFSHKTTSQIVTLVVLELQLCVRAL